MALEDYVNTQVTAVMNAEQYATLVAAVTVFVEEHPEQVDAIRELKSIEYIRTR